MQKYVVFLLYLVEYLATLQIYSTYLSNLSLGTTDKNNQSILSWFLVLPNKISKFLHKNKYMNVFTVPLIDDEAQRGESEQDVAGHPQHGELGQRLQKESRNICMP